METTTKFGGAKVQRCPRGLELIGKIMDMTELEGLQWSILTSCKTTINSLWQLGSPAGWGDKECCLAGGHGCPCSSSATVEAGEHAVPEWITLLERHGLDRTFVVSSKGGTIAYQKTLSCRSGGKID